MKRIFAALALLLPFASAHVLGQDDLAAAKDLYVAAKYEEALAAFDRLKAAGTTTTTPESALSVAQYRAMCLLALNRKEEAERAIEAVSDLDPFYQPAEDEAAPWVRAAFRETRRKVLPAVLQRVYGRGKEAYDRKAMPDAIEAFTRVLRLLDEPDLTLDAAARGDMRLVTRAFLDLSKAALASASSPAPTPGPGDRPADAAAVTPAGTSARRPDDAAPPAAPEKAAQNGAPLPAVGAPVIYDASAAGVTPPLPLRRDVPNWPYSPRDQKGGAVVVELVVRENGTIESVVVRDSAGKYNDQVVAQAARNWLYRPAMKGATAVRYRLLVRVVLGG